LRHNQIGFTKGIRMLVERAKRPPELVRNSGVHYSGSIGCLHLYWLHL
jgi:hypothetical protein